jgi:hypothetical protein
MNILTTLYQCIVFGVWSRLLTYCRHKTTTEALRYTMKSNEASKSNGNGNGNGNNIANNSNSHVQAILLNRLTEHHAQRQGTSSSNHHDPKTLSDFLEVAIELSSSTLAQEAQFASICDAVSNSNVESTSLDSSRPDEGSA